MVALADKKGVAPFLTALNGSQLKNRIVMMKKKTENRFTLLKQLVLLPLLAVLVMGLANRKVKIELIQQQNETIEIQTENQKETAVSGKICITVMPSQTQLFHEVTAFAPNSFAEIFSMCTFMIPTFFTAGALNLNFRSLYWAMNRCRQRSFSL